MVTFTPVILNMSYSPLTGALGASIFTINGNNVTCSVAPDGNSCSYILNMTQDTPYTVVGWANFLGVYIQTDALTAFYYLPPINQTATIITPTWNDVTNSVAAFYFDYAQLIFPILCFGFAFVITKTIPQTMIAGGVGLACCYFLPPTGNLIFVVGAAASIIIGLIYKQVVG
jgi:hypothetical protein